MLKNPIVRVSVNFPGQITRLGAFELIFYTVLLQLLTLLLVSSVSRKITHGVAP